MTSQHPPAGGLSGTGGLAPGAPAAAEAVADGAEVIRSEEQLSVERRSEVVGRVRIAKRVFTEERQVTVTVRREELVVEELPVDGTTSDATSDAPSDAGGDAPAADGRLTGGARGSHAGPVLELLLSEEEVEVVTRVVPRERVRVFVDTVTGSVEVAETLAKEVVDVEGTEGDPTGPDGDAPRTERGATR